MTTKESSLSESVFDQSLAQRIFQSSHLTGEFLLRSGKTSKEYFDKYQFESDPVLLLDIAKGLVPLIPANTDYLAALEMGGIPVATALSLQTGLPVVFVRKEAKEYGTCKFAEGPAINGKRLTLIEDVITTGGQVAISTKDLRAVGALVEHVLCVIDRSQGQTQKIVAEGLKLHALFTMAQLKASAQNR
jgi:orotate phosphoribosyltransferase